ncbi:MAG: hypothetical protein EPN45_19920 [Rhizobiaceae bacterium]|nr:MAG: hypothetical protein EPN45_19920 [Rhizobiaceae bacterium]
MQIIRTEVAKATALSGEPILRVLFCGEGGDCVTVDMGSIVPGTDESALDRARAILVQTATFGMAANDYDAESKGNFDEVGVTAANDKNGGIYAFEYRDGEGSREVPSRMPSLKAAREEAVRCAIDLLADLQSGTDARSGWLVRVRDENGELLCTIEVEEAGWLGRRTSEGATASRNGSRCRIALSARFCVEVSSASSPPLEGHLR